MKLAKSLRLFLFFFVGVVTLSVTVLAVIELKGRHQDKIARSAAEDLTASYRRRFVMGETLASVENSLALLHAKTLHRGDDEILIIAKEGRPVWYCSHNYFGTSLRFEEGRLRRLETDEWLETCL